MTARAPIDLLSFVRSGTPGCSQIAASKPKPQIAAAIPSINPTERRPCSNVRSVCVSDNRAIQDGFVSVTPLHVDLTDHRMIADAEQWWREP